MIDSRYSRRAFLERTALLAGAASAATACGEISEQEAPGTPDRSNGLTVNAAGYRYPRVEALFDGSVEIEGATLVYREMGIGEMNSDVLGGAQTLDVTEIGLHPFMLAYANDQFREYTLLPVFPLRQFRHKSVFIRTDRGITSPRDLVGKTIATPGYSATSLVWIRGVFQDEYGVSPADVDWLVSAGDSAADISGSVSAQEGVVPEGISIRAGPPGMDESDLLESGEVDALFHAVEPRSYVQRDPIVSRLFPDHRAVEQDYYNRTGVFPIMHAVAIRASLIDESPGLVEAVFEAYSRAKSLTYQQMNRLGWANDMLPWYAQELENTRDLMGDNFYTYGIAPNRATLDTLFRYSHEQGLASRRLTIEELFHPLGMSLSEGA